MIQCDHGESKDIWSGTGFERMYKEIQEEDILGTIYISGLNVSLRLLDYEA